MENGWLIRTFIAYQVLLKVVMDCHLALKLSSHQVLARQLLLLVLHVRYNVQTQHFIIWMDQLQLHALTMEGKFTPLK